MRIPVGLTPLNVDNVPEYAVAKTQHRQKGPNKGCFFAIAGETWMCPPPPAVPAQGWTTHALR